MMIFPKRELFTTTCILLSFFCLIFLSLAGCNQQEATPPVSVKEVKPALLQTLTIGLIPEQDVFIQKKRYEPLLDLLGKELGIAIEIKMLPRYGNIIDNFNNLGLDAAFFGSFTGALAIEKLGIEPLARPQYFGGASSYYGMVFVRKDSGISSAEDMRGKRMVFVDRSTTAGYLLPLTYFKALGIEDFSEWFNECYFSGTHEDAINDVLNGLADIGAAKNTVFYRMAATDKRLLNELEILETSPRVPANGLAVRPDLDPDLKIRLKQKLLSLHQIPEGLSVLHSLNMEYFIETTVEDYQPVLDYAESIGLDLKTYDCMNN